MGGMGSGPRRPLGTKRTVESRRRISLAVLKERGLLRPGTEATGTFECDPVGGPGVALYTNNPDEYTGPVGYALVLGAKTGSLCLAYRDGMTDGPLEQVVPLVTTRAQFGGARWWFRCSCGTRRGALYLRWNWFACRRCQLLAFWSAQNSDTRVRELVRAGVDYDALNGPWDSVADLGFRLKVSVYLMRREARARYR